MLHIDVFIITIYKQVQKVTIEINHVNYGNPSLKLATKVGAQAEMMARRMLQDSSTSSQVWESVRKGIPRLTSDNHFKNPKKVLNILNKSVNSTHDPN